MKRAVIVEAPGKINLSLDLMGKRPDGYHEIDTVMQSIDLYDRVALSRMSGKGIYISCDHPLIPHDQENLAHVAARAFFKEFGVTENRALSIDLQKRLPVQAGMGGGSADAAAVLVGMNVLYEVYADWDLLCKLGQTVGADVPFCIQGGTKRARGTGEQLSPLPAMPSCQIVVAQPAKGISTAACYRWYDEAATPPRTDVGRVVRALHAGDITALAQSVGNVLEPQVQLEDVARLRERILSCGALGAMMTGSGSAVFGIFESSTLAKRCMHKIYDYAERVFLVRPVSHGAMVIGSVESSAAQVSS